MENPQNSNPFSIDFISNSNDRRIGYPSDNLIDQSSEDEDERSSPLSTSTNNAINPKNISSIQGREFLLKNILDSKKDLYTDLRGYKVYICTWNVNGQSPGSICLSEWLSRAPEPPEIIAVGFQELDLSKEAFLFNDSPREHEWLNSVRRGLPPKGNYRKLKLVRLVGMMLIVFVKEELHKLVRNVCAESVGTGILGKMGNKGGVGIRFDLEETSICFVNCHLAAHVEEYQRRNQDFNQILTRMIFYPPQGLTYISDHDQVFWFGDMNYRISPTALDPEKAKSLIEREKYAEVLKYDQLKDQVSLGKVFPGFQEGLITFRPTYKYDTGTNNWDSSEKNRSPAWCDRILSRGENISQHEYSSSPQYTLSDHKPVSSSFEVRVKVVDPVRYRKHYEEALKWLDKEENKCLPQVSVEIPETNPQSHSNRNEIHFGDVKFLQPVSRTFSVRNTGQFPVRVEFINKLNDTQICKDWLSVEPASTYIQAGKSSVIKLQVLVDKRSAGQLNIGKDTLYDILVLHLDGGKDIFITVVGEYKRSVFGCLIMSLVNLRVPMCDTTPGKLIELEKGNLPVDHYGIPKELWFLVDRLYRVGLEKESLFSQSGLMEDLYEIRDWLDEIPNNVVPGSVDSIAEALLLLLESFPEPVIPFALHLKCIDAATHYTTAKEVLKLLPDAHRNVFVYISSFLRELLLHSDKNGLDAKVLAMLFGRVMLRDPSNVSKVNSKVERQKATFIYQFLVNEDYEDGL